MFTGTHRVDSAVDLQFTQSSSDKYTICVILTKVNRQARRVSIFFAAQVSCSILYGTKLIGRHYPSHRMNGTGCLSSHCFHSVSRCGCVSAWTFSGLDVYDFCGVVHGRISPGARRLRHRSKRISCSWNLPRLVSTYIFGTVYVKPPHLCLYPRESCCSSCPPRRSVIAKFIPALKEHVARRLPNGLQYTGQAATDRTVVR